MRLLLIEDNPERIDIISRWVPATVRLVVANSAGKAIGILQRDRGRTFVGILLDHDLNEQAITSRDLDLSGKDVTKAIARHVSRDTPILVHSMNTSGGPAMATSLRAAGFEVAQIRMAVLDHQKFTAWLAEAIELWELESDSGA